MTAKKNTPENNIEKTDHTVPAEQQEKDKENDVMCGIIMPISDHNDYPKGHWKEVEDIIKSVLTSIGLKSRIVSDDESVGLIQERIVTNIYNDDIVVCDVSSKNPNVMFELGLRLAFDKPTIIIIDDKTGYSFDVGSIEHLSYPSSLRFSDIISFKEKLAQKVEATLKKHIEDVTYSPFLKSFGRTIVPAKIHATEIPVNEFFVEELKRMSGLLNTLVHKDRNRKIINKNTNTYSSSDLDILFKNFEMELEYYPSIIEKIEKLKIRARNNEFSMIERNFVINDFYKKNLDVFSLFNEEEIKHYLNYAIF
ncbi:hypothetical protein [Myroides fluvii]|uniref:hypothetical protein n=1 Tax=Myroides fluvii TaxID=2572594 RepID=UPI00131E7321|nr:hypothetical protein [Myroides fluvii]